MALTVKPKWISPDMTDDTELNAEAIARQTADSAFNTRINNLENSGIVFVNTKSDFPTASSGVITLEANRTYFITDTVDLTGDRLVCSNNTTLIGGSSENCILKSTGLSSSTALISSLYSLPMRNLAITHGTALNLDGTATPTAALDWFGVNFTSCAIVGTIKSYSNFIMSDCALLSSANMNFDGTFGTIGFVNCLFSGIAAQTTLNFPATLTITRRIRAIYSSFIAFGGATAINVSTSATIPVEGYILDTINFSGGATYTAGVQYNDNKSLFSNCKGVTNSTELGQMYFANNATQNTIATQSVFEKILGTTTASSINERFTHANNQLTYTGAITRSFVITASCSASSITTANATITVRIAKNGTTLAESEAQATTSAVNRNENFFCQTIVQLAQNDFIEIFIANNSSALNLLASELNVVIRAVN